MLKFIDVAVAYEGGTVFSGLTLSFTPGSIYILTGPSGCGKSTLLKVAAGIVRPASGRVEFSPCEGSERIRPPRIGYVPQNHGLLEHKTVEGNIFLPFKLGAGAKQSGNEPSLSSLEIINRLGLADLLGKYPAELSGGQRQRAALARAFVMSAEVMLLDEPFSALDTFTADACRDLFLELWSVLKPLTIFVTHDLHEAALLGREILIMEAGRVTRFPNPVFGPNGGDGESRAEAVVLQLKKMIRPRL